MMCGKEAEILLHLFLNCKKLKDFFTSLKDCLKKKWGRVFVDNLDWKTVIVFGIAGKNKKVTFNLLNFVLSHARCAV